jgi:uncharacterized cupredoxin-like copper-binding protein
MNSAVLRLIGRSALALIPAIVLLSGCGDADHGATATTAVTEARPSATIQLADGKMTVPAELPGGLVELHLVAAPGEQPHHLAFLRLADGVTFAQAEAATDDTGLFTFAGGNGQLAPGDEMTLTLDLEPGDYSVFDLPFGQEAASAPTTVVAPTGSPVAPSADATITLGPSLGIGVPDDVAAGGTWHFTNDEASTEPHEAILLRLADGLTPKDVVDWAKTFAGPPPADFIGGFGAVGPGHQGWIQEATPLEPGSYAFACFLPGADGVPHVAAGMITGFTVP